jgi:hypothetical protein
MEYAELQAGTLWFIGSGQLFMKSKRRIVRLCSFDGQTMTEYALLLATIAIIVVSLYRTSGSIVELLMNTIDGSL